MEKPIDTENPWVGISSYEDPEIAIREGREPKLFCSREEESQALTQLIASNILTTLYGKSGTGKTSLLNAGVFPLLRKKHYSPVSIRLSTDSQGQSLQQCIISKIEQVVQREGCQFHTTEVVSLAPEKQPDYLWSYFARTHFFKTDPESGNTFTLFPVIALDQFEEVLRDRQSDTETLLRQIAYLMDESHALSNRTINGIPYQYDFNFRFVISIREDNLYRLEDSIDNNYLSEMKRCRYRLRSLSEQGAMGAILLPGQHCIKEDEQNDVAQHIIELAKRSKGGEIDTLLLSIICAGTFSKKKGQTITLEDLSIWGDNPMEVYYRDAIKGMSDKQVRFIQQNLVREDGSRCQIDAEEANTALGELTYKALSQGNNRIMSIDEQGRVELLHDQLALAVFEDRKETEEKEKKKKQRQRQFGFIGGSLILIVLWIFIFQFFRIRSLHKKIQEDQSRFVAEKIISIVNSDSYLAMRLAIAVLPKDLNRFDDRPYTPEADAALRMATRYQTSVLKGHTSWINSAAYSPDGKRIVSASNDKTVRIWNAETGDTILVLRKEPPSNVNSAVFSADGNFILTSSNGFINILDSKTGKSLFKRNANSHLAIFSPDGKNIVSVNDNNSIDIRDTRTGLMLRTMEGHTSWINSVAYSPDGKRIVSASDDQTIRIWDSEIGIELMILRGHNGDVNSAVFSPDGNFIASASSDNTLMLWDAHSGKILDTLKGHSGSVNSVSFSPDGNYLTSASNDKTVMLWDAQSKTSMGIYKGHTNNVLSVAFSPDGKHIASASDDNTIRIIDLNKDLEITVIDKTHSCTNYATYSPDGTLIVSVAIDTVLASPTYSVQIWDIENGIVVFSLDDLHYSVEKAVFESDIKYIDLYSQNTIIRLDTKTGKTSSLRILDPGYGITFLPQSITDNTNVNYKIGNDYSIYLYDTIIHNDTIVLKGHTAEIKSLDYSPDGKYVVTASMDKTIRIWDVNSGLALQVFTGHTNGVNSAIFSPDNRHIVSTSHDGTIRIWDFPPLQELIDQTRERFKDRPLTPEERKMYYLE